MTILRQPWRWLPFGLRLTLARLRSRASQYRLFRRSVLWGAVALTLVVLGGARAQSADARSTWGTTVEVLVITNGIAAGDPFEGSTELVDRPAAFVPNDAISGLVGDLEHTVRALEPGDIVTDRDLASSGHGVRLDANQRAVSLPLGPRVPAVNVGDQVELYVVFDNFGDVSEEPTRVDTAIVIAIGANDLTVAVDADDVSMLAQASTSGQVVVARR